MLTAFHSPGGCGGLTLSPYILRLSLPLEQQNLIADHLGVHVDSARPRAQQAIFRIGEIRRSLGRRIGTLSIRV